MEWLHHQQGCSRQHELAKHTQYRSHSSSLHLRPHSSSAWQHTITYGSEARRGFQVRRHTAPRLESPSWQTTDNMDESDRAGHRTHCCWRMGYRWRPVNMEGATTHSRLRAAVSEWFIATICQWVTLWLYMIANHGVNDLNDHRTLHFLFIVSAFRVVLTHRTLFTINYGSS